MEILERTALALEKVEAIKLGGNPQNEKHVYENLRKDLAGDIKEALNKRPEISNELDSQDFANNVLPSIIKKMPSTKDFDKEMKEITQKVAEKFEILGKNQRENEVSMNKILGFLCIFLSITSLIFGFSTWHFSNYKKDAYKYSYSKIDVYLNDSILRKNYFEHLDAVGNSNFEFIENTMDTTNFTQKYQLKEEQKAAELAKKVMPKTFKK